jgi:hypothetical protein
MFDSSMYEELRMRTRHVVQGSEAVVFQMKSWDVLRVENVLSLPGVCSQSQQLRSRAMQCCSGMDRCYWMPRGSSPCTAVTLELERETCIGRRASLCEP